MSSYSANTFFIPLPYLPPIEPPPLTTTCHTIPHHFRCANHQYNIVSHHYYRYSCVCYDVFYCSLFYSYIHLPNAILTNAYHACGGDGERREEKPPYYSDD